VPSTTQFGGPVFGGRNNSPYLLQASTSKLEKRLDQVATSTCGGPPQAQKQLSPTRALAAILESFARTLAFCCTFEKKAGPKICARTRLKFNPQSFVDELESNMRLADLNRPNGFGREPRQRWIDWQPEPREAVPRNRWTSRPRIRSPGPLDVEFAYVECTRLWTDDACCSSETFEGSIMRSMASPVEMSCREPLESNRRSCRS